MKYIVTILLLLFSISGRSQVDYNILNKELSSLYKKGIDTVIVYGSRCSECNGSTISKYYLAYDSVDNPFCKLIVIYNEDFDSRITFDTAYSCDECGIILRYVNENHSKLLNQLNGIDYLLNKKTVINGITCFGQTIDVGNCYFFGVCTKDNLLYFTLNKNENINNLFLTGHICWSFFSLMKNEWPTD